MKCPEDSEFVCCLEWNEDLYQEALSWVDEKRRAAFITDQERESLDPRVKIYSLESPLQLPKILKQIAWSATFRKLHIVGEESLKQDLEQMTTAAHLILSEASSYRVGVMKNARLNDGFYRRGMDLQGAFPNIPALIVGAGPSLEKNGHLIKAFEEKALIFAGGSALNLLESEPHFAASIDPIAPYRQFKAHPFSDTPFCYQARMNAENFSLVHGEKILFPDSSCEAINWIYQEEPLDGGWTVGNFLTRIAIHMGCSPIIFVGMDFCYEQGRKYAKIEADSAGELIQVRNAMTQRDWWMAAQWTEEREKERELIDTSQGILKIPKMTLEEVLQRCPGTWDLRRAVYEAIQKLPLRKTDRWKDWENSLKRCQKQFDGEIVYDKLLKPLWDIWRPIFEREAEGQKMDLHQRIFFQKVLEEHG